MSLSVAVRGCVLTMTRMMTPLTPLLRSASPATTHRPAASSFCVSAAAPEQASSSSSAVRDPNGRCPLSAADQRHVAMTTPRPTTTTHRHAVTTHRLIDSACSAAAVVRAHRSSSAERSLQAVHGKPSTSRKIVVHRLAPDVEVSSTFSYTYDRCRSNSSVKITVVSARW